MQARFIGMLPLSPNALRVLEARYLRRDAAGKRIEDFEGLCIRVADAVAAAEDEFGGDSESTSERYRNLLSSREFLPNSPTLMNAGTDMGQLSACFVIPVDDSLDGIFEAVRRMAVIHQSGGGTGFAFSRLRPAGDPVSDTSGVAAGPMAFLDVFDKAAGVIVQGGKRRGANMGVMRIDHPDVEAFIASKATHDAGLSNFNLSVGATDAFFAAAGRGESFDLVNPRGEKVARSVSASGLLDAISKAAWECGDPGIVFLDAMAYDHPTPGQGPLEATNPCGELPLLPNESCNLGSIRLDLFARDGGIDWERLDGVVDLAVRFLDDVIEVNRYPFEEIAKRTRENRKIGLGVMGFADLLVDLGIPYDSRESLAMADQVMGRIRRRAEFASRALASERSVFPAWPTSTLARRGCVQRNATLTSIAPTGTLSILADCSSGIEPYFALSYVRHVLDGAELPETTPRLERALRTAGAWSEDLAAEVRATGRLRGLSGVPDAVARLFPTAADIAPEAHLDVQEAFQCHVDNAVSKTINLPEHATPRDIREIYTSAWRRQLKGVTVFREGSKQSQAVLTRGIQAQSDCPDC